VDTSAGGIYEANQCAAPSADRRYHRRFAAKFVITFGRGNVLPLLRSSLNFVTASRISVIVEGEEAQTMTITLPLQPQEEARLIAAAQARGLSADALVREALDGILAETPRGSSKKEPTRSLRGLLAKYGPAPSAEDIDQNRAEMFANFPRSDF
jgi:hypothetical protein